MSPQIGDGAINSIAYWDGVYGAGDYPTLQVDNQQRYRAAAARQVGTWALDVGCGQCGLGAILLGQYSGLTYVGLDYSEAALRTHMLDQSQAARWVLFCGDWRSELAAMARGMRFDTVYLNEILEHEPDPAALLAAVAPLAARRIVVTVPRYQALCWLEHRGEHAWDFTEQELCELLSPYGQVGDFGAGNHICTVVHVDIRKGG